MVNTDVALQQVKHLSLLRSFHVADFITLANAFAGTASILAMMSYLVMPQSWRVYTAIGLLVLALVCDVMDGYVAR